MHIPVFIQPQLPHCYRDQNYNFHPIILQPDQKRCQVRPRVWYKYSMPSKEVNKSAVASIFLQIEIGALKLYSHKQGTCTSTETLEKTS